MFGIDVSKWDAKPLNWSVAKMDFIFIKASEGTVQDPLFRQQWDAAKGHTLRGAYHFHRNFVNPHDSANKLVQILGNDRGELPIVLDLEATNGYLNTIDLAKTWCADIYNLTGTDPIIYSTIPFMVEIGATKKILGFWKHQWLKGKMFWIAQYSFDKWPDTMRDLRIQAIMDGDILLPMPSVDALPPLKTQLHQWTARGKPEQVPGYYNEPDGKRAIDFNFANKEWLDQFTLPPKMTMTAVFGDKTVNFKEA